MADYSHGFLIPGNQLGDTLIVDLHESNGKYSRQKMPVPSMDSLAAVKDNGNPPAISEARVTEVKHGVFLSATIAWQTDTLTDSSVRYGVNGLSESSETITRLGRFHEVVLYKLEPDASYTFTVVSRDLFGRSSTSPPMTFSTTTPFSTTLTTGQDGQQQSRKSAVTAMEFQRLGADFLFTLNLERPASVYIGSQGTPYIRPKPEVNARNLIAGAETPENESHRDLSDKTVNSLKACHRCHKNTATATHPVNVYPKPGMTIPPEYPTLPDRRITCATCHTTHSSNNPFLTRKRSNRELCIGCHKDMM